MKRRKFLGFLGGAAVAGPSMATSAAKTGMASLDLGAIAAPGLGGYEGFHFDGGPVTSDTSWATKRLKAVKNMLPWVRAHKMRTFNLVALDPNTASLRSVSLGQKMRISRRIQYDAHEVHNQTYLNGVIKGVFD